jgi:hypothetical protein
LNLKNQKYYDVSQFSQEELCEIHNDLNRWNWSNKLGEKPTGWDNMKVDAKYKIILPILQEIKEFVSHKKLLRYHHIHNMNKTPEQFEEWWQEEYLGNL